MWSFISKLFQAKSKEKNWLDELFENIEKISMEHRQIRCKVVDIKSKGFLVRVKGMFAYLPFKCMPWKYTRIEYWQFLFPMLKGRSFLCTITDAKKEDDKHFVIHVDASKHPLDEMQLVENEEYSALVLQRSTYGVFIDLGYHFGWASGASVGLLHRTNFANEDSFVKCLEGEVVKVVFTGHSDKGMIFVEAASYSKEIINWRSAKMGAYIGKEVEVHVNKGYRQASFLVENQYPVIVAGLPDDFDADKSKIIPCKISAIDLQNKCFTAYLIAPTPLKSSKRSLDPEGMNKYIGQKVSVNIRQILDGYSFFVENKYPARLSVKKFPANFNVDENKTISCKVVGISHTKKYLQVKWAAPSEEECEQIDWNSTELKKYIGLQMPVNMYESEGEVKFFVDNLYPGRLPVNLPKQYLVGKDFAQCTIVAIDRAKSCFELRWEGLKGHYDTDWTSPRVEEYIGKEATVTVYHGGAEPLYYFENRYPARLEAKPENFTFDAQIFCTVESIDVENKQFVLSWLGPYSCEKIDWESKKMQDFIGRQVSVNIYRIEGKPKLFVSNRYPAKLPEEQARRIAKKDLVMLFVTSINVEQRCFNLQLANQGTKKENLSLSVEKIIDIIDPNTANKLRTISSEGQKEEDEN
ncbi:MAG: hypothetical protein LBC98_08100 [Prevotellaceae bacterium]|jgi:hypothetical protein|nr:hypothetical protein [Prevotellaceae bacterium]